MTAPSRAMRARWPRSRVAEADLRLNETNLAKACICSPIDGVVLKRNVDPGQTVASSLQAPVLFVIAEDLRHMELQVDVDEADVGKVKVGQKATFSVDAYPERKFPAEIRDIRYGSETVQGVVTYKAVLTIDNSDLLIRPGMTATAEIVVQQVSDALLVPNAALRFSPKSAQANRRSGGFLQRLLPRFPFAPSAEQAGGHRSKQKSGCCATAPSRGSSRDRRDRRPKDRDRRGRDRAGAADHRRRRTPNADEARVTKPRRITHRSSSSASYQGLWLRRRAVHALAGVDLTIGEGEFVAIMGPSGSGKSTAMNIIGCLDTPTAGEYLFKGIEVGQLDRNQRALLRRHFLGFVFQGFNLLARTTAVENVELPLIYRGMPPAERRRLALGALERVGLEGREHHTSAELSGGQQQRVAIARAIVTDPDGAAGRRADRQSRHQDQPRDHGAADRPQPRPGHHGRSWSRTRPTSPPMRAASSASSTAGSSPMSAAERPPDAARSHQARAAGDPAQRAALVPDRARHRHRRRLPSSPW